MHLYRCKGGKRNDTNHRSAVEWRAGFCEHCGAHDSEANRLIRETAKNRDALLAQLPQKQQMLLQSYVDQTERYTLRMMELAFRDGFSVGVRLLTEGLYEN